MKLRIEANAIGQGKVTLDGIELKGVTELDVRFQVGQLNQATFTIFPEIVEIDAEVPDAELIVGDQAMKFAQIRVSE